MAHTHARLLVHIVFSTKRREAVLREPVRGDLFGYIEGVARNIGVSVIAANGVEDHVHPLVAIPTSASVAEVVRDIKANSSRWLSERFAFEWQAGYGAFSVSESARESVAAYIAGQVEHHRRSSFEDEYLALLARHNVEYDPAWVFDE